MEPTPPRYAVYYVPERGSALERLGSSLLGRSVYTGETLPQPVLEGFAPEDAFFLLREAGRYGLHATLKPPFFLKPGTTEEELIRAAEHFAQGRRPFFLPALAVVRIGSFFALAMRPQTDTEAEEAENIYRMAREAVPFFDGFRAPPSEKELARRREKGLTPRQEAYLCRWGYPYVFDEFRFHVTLMNAAPNPYLAAMQEKSLNLYMAPALGGGSWIDAIAICRSDQEGVFTVLHQAGFKSLPVSPRPMPACSTAPFSAYPARNRV